MADDIEFTVADTAPVLHRGDHGPWVRYLKQLLDHNKVPPGAINESFDATTEAAVRQFQHSYVGLNDVHTLGVVDHATWSRLIGRAEDIEHGDDVLGGLVMGDAALDKLQRTEINLEPGDEVARGGWVRVDVHVSVHDCYGVPVPEALAYARFTEKEGEHTSDETTHVHHGRMLFNDVWIPRSGWFHLFVDSHQPTLSGDPLGHVEGLASFECNSKTVIFRARQDKGDTVTLTESEAHTHGLSTSWSVEGNASIPWVGGPSASYSEGGGTSDETSHESGKEYTFVFPGHGFAQFEQER
jgi:Putative peptidoglycan binding domain